MSQRLPNNDLCPHCFKLLTAASSAEGLDNSPKPGDFTMCVYCGTPLVFDDNLHQRVPTEEELQELSPEMLQKMRRASYLHLNRLRLEPDGR